MIRQEQINNMVSHGQASIDEAENWYENKERILDLHMGLLGEDASDALLEWFYQQAEVYTELTDEQLKQLFQRYNAYCIACGGTGYKEVDYGC